jgi:hypothetical protein
MEKQGPLRIRKSQSGSYQPTLNYRRYAREYFTQKRKKSNHKHERSGWNETEMGKRQTHEN